MVMLDLSLHLMHTNMYCSAHLKPPISAEDFSSSGAGAGAGAAAVHVVSQGVRSNPPEDLHGGLRVGVVGRLEAQLLQA